MKSLQFLFLLAFVFLVASDEHSATNNSVDIEYAFMGLYEDGSGAGTNVLPPAGFTAPVVLCLIITCVGLIVNAVVLFVIFGSGEANKSITALYVAQLAIADSIFLITLPFNQMQRIIGQWQFGSWMCTFCQSVKFFNYFAGIFFLTAMSVDRYIAVAYSTRSSEYRTKTRSRMVCLMIWLASVVMSLPAILYGQVEDMGENGGKKCRIMYPGYIKFNESELIEIYFSNGHDLYNSSIEEGNDSHLNDNYYYSENNDVPSIKGCSFSNQPNIFVVVEIIKFIIGFVVPLIIISISYFFIIRKLLISEKKLENSFGKRTQKMNQRVTRMVAVLILCFVICWLPYHVYRFLRIKGLDLTVATCNLIESLLSVLGFSNSMFNPILYTFLGNKFPERLRKSFERTKRGLSQGGWVLSSQYNVTRKSNQRPTTTKRVTDQGPAAPVTTGSDTVLTENQVMRDGRRIPIMEMSQRKPTDTTWANASEQDEKSHCLSRS